MKFKLTAMPVIFALLVPACTSTYDLTTSPRESHPWLEKQYRTYHDFLAEAKGNSAEIVTTDGRFVGRVTRADADSIGWTDSSQDSTAHLLPTSQVQLLRITRNSHSWWLGGLVGLAGTMGFTYAAGLWEPVGGNHLDYSGPRSVPLFVIGGTIIGGLVGNAIHHTDQYLTGTPGSADTTKFRSHD